MPFVGRRRAQENAINFDCEVIYRRHDFVYPVTLLIILLAASLQLDVLDLLQIKSFAKAKDFGTFCETFAKDPVIYNITLKFASS